MIITNIIIRIHKITSIESRGIATAAPAGLMCLNEAAAGKSIADFNSETSCHPLSASPKLMYPGDPFKTKQ